MAHSYLVGIGVTHSIAAPMHNFITRSLGYDCEFTSEECPTVDDAMRLFRQPNFAGGVVTMPYKTTIMQHLDGLDEQAIRIGACNNVYRASDGRLRGTNTDWLGIQGCLLNVTSEGKSKPALIIGAGGASRAALYALVERLDCKSIYVVNRDLDEVQALFKDAEVYGEQLEILHVVSVKQARDLPCPFYVVGTVPDFEPQTMPEVEARDIVEQFLSCSVGRGVILDMCYKPRRTRLLKSGEQYGWRTVEGTGIIAHQIEEQYRLWYGGDASRAIDTEGARAVLNESAASSPAINF